MNSQILFVEYHIPVKKLTNQELSIEFPEWSPEKISSKTGIYERGICDENEFASDLAINAAKKLFDKYGIEKNEIDFLLYCTQSPDYLLPTTACLIHKELGLNSNCGALDFNLGCSGYIYGLSLAKGLIGSGDASNVLLITSETYSKYIHPEDKSNRTIFGDAAAATLICVTTEPGLEKFVFGTDGFGAMNLIVKTGGIRKRVPSMFVEYSEGNFVKSDDHLFMDGQEIFKFTTREVPLLVDRCLKLNNLQISQIDLFVFHQANRYMLDFIRRKLNIPADRFFVSLELTGNTVSSTIPIALTEAMKIGKLERGMKVMLVGFGVGYSSGAVVFNF